jgi:predicted Fe-Mo cluster-binding NifX family protein
MKKWIGFLLALLVVFSSNAFAADTSLIAVAADDQKPSAPVSAVAARCRYFLLFDDQGTFGKAIDNPYLSSSGPAGKQVVDFLAAKNVKVVIAGEFGKNMLDAMQAKGLTHVQFKGNADEAVKTAIKK